MSEPADHDNKWNRLNRIAETVDKVISIIRNTFGQQAACSRNQLLSAEQEKVKELTREIILRKKHNN